MRINDGLELIIIMAFKLKDGSLHAFRELQDVLVMVGIAAHTCAKLLCCPQITDGCIEHKLESLPWGSAPLSIYLLYNKFLQESNFAGL